MTNKKQLSVNLIANIASYSVNIIISFFLTPYLIRVLGKETYSFYPIANNFVQYMSIVTIALNSMASRFITIEIAKRNFKKAGVYFSSVFYSNIILSSILLIPMTATVIFLEKLLNIPIDMVLSIKILFILVFASMLINIVTSVFSVAVFARNRIDLRSIADIIHSVLKLILYVVLFYLFVPNIIYVGSISVALALITFLIHWIYTRRLLPDIHIRRSDFDVCAIKEILSSGIWNSINQIGSALMFSLSIVYCNVLVSTAAGGEYSIIQTVPNFINGIISTLAAVFIPAVTQTYATKPIEDVVSEIKMSQKIMGIITNVPIVIFMVIGVDFYRLWVPGENAMRLHILSILTIFHLLFIGVTWTVANLNTVLNKVKVPALYLIGSGIVNFFLVLALTKFTNLGVYAIPLSSAIILFIWAAFFIPLYPCKVLNIKWNTFYPAIYKMLISSALLLGITFSLRRIISVHSWLGLIAFCILCGCIGLLINLMISLSKSDRQQFFNKLLSKIKKA
ncbi:MAG: MATE family efflux transporter [Clostridia bacterium]|nr:MATE family efflux transporter [Clostridia bacterium]